MQAPNQHAAIERELSLAGTRLAAKGLLKPGDALSQRIPEHRAYLSLRIGSDGDAGTCVWTALEETGTDLHGRIYAARPDVGAIAAGALTWTGSLALLDRTMPAVFDEQARHLGLEALRVHRRADQPGRLPMLDNGANAYCLDDLVVCLGMGLERLLLNIEILEKCAECFVLAQASGQPVHRLPWLVRYIANGRLKKDRKEAAARHLRGERSLMKAGY